MTEDTLVSPLTTRTRLGLCLAMSAVALVLGSLPFTSAMENRSYDFFMRFVAWQESPSEEIVLIGIDDSSLERLEPAVGRWPWPRAVFASMIDYCAEAAVVGFDIVFPEADWERATSDDLMAKSVNKHGNVVSAIYCDEPPDMKSQHALSKFGLDDPYARMSGLPQFGSALIPYENLLEATASVGHVNYLEDKDGILRAHPTVIRLGGTSLPSLSLACARAYLKTREPEGPQLSVASRFLIAPNRGGYRLVNIADVLTSWQSEQDGEEPVVSRSVFKDKIVLVGSFATGLQDDRKVTSLSTATPGMTVSAMALDNILTGRRVRKAPFEVAVALLIALALAPGLAKIDRPQFLIMISGATATGYFVLVSATVYMGYLILPVILPLLGLAHSSVLLGSVYWYQERARRKRLQALDIAKQQFSDMLVHDMKNRVGSVLMTLDVMQHFTAGNEALAETVDTARATTNQLMSQAKSLLDIRKMQEQKMTLNLQESELVPLIQEILKEHDAASRMIGVVMRFEPDVSPTVSLDAEVFSRIVGNLLWNALEHAVAGRDFEIGLHESGDGEIVFYVANEGEAIPTEDMGVILEAFVSGTVQKEGKTMSGTGLGLAFCKLAVEAHGWSIEIESPWQGHDNGVRVILRIPPADK